jgi:hypothetical protein
LNSYEVLKKCKIDFELTHENKVGRQRMSEWPGLGRSTQHIRVERPSASSWASVAQQPSSMAATPALLLTPSLCLVLACAAAAPSLVLTLIASLSISQGFESIVYLLTSSGAYLLGLCEGNYCKGGSEGKEPGNGRIIISQYKEWRWVGCLQVLPVEPVENNVKPGGWQLRARIGKGNTFPQGLIGCAREPAVCSRASPAEASK